MNKSKYLTSGSRKESKQLDSCIAYDQFDLLLSTLPEEEARQLEQIVKNHALIQHRPLERYFTGRDSIMGEIRHLIDTYANEITFLDSNLSIDQSHAHYVADKQIFYSRGLEVTPQNYKRMMKDIKVMTALPSNRFELCFSEKQSLFRQEGSSKEWQVIITNRCVGNKRIYLIFQLVHEIIELISLIDEEMALSKLSSVIDSFAGEENNMVKTPVGKDKQLYFFKLSAQTKRKGEDWLKFIHNMNKKFSPEDVILMKYRHFDQLLQHKAYFTNNIRVAFNPDELRLTVSQVSQLKVYENTVQSIHFLRETAIEVLSRGASHLKYKGKQVDAVTAFNVCLLEERNGDSMVFVEQSQTSKKEFVFFTFFRQLMQIERDPQTQSVRLIESSISEEISNKLYLTAIQKLKKFAVLNQLPFFTLFQDAIQVLPLNPSKLEYTQTGDLAKLLCYRYLLALKRYKLIVQDSLDEKELLLEYERPLAITFERKSSFFLKMGKLKSDSIVKKQRFREGEVEKGRIVVEAHFGRLFIEKCLEELAPQ